MGAVAGFLGIGSKGASYNAAAAPVANPLATLAQPNYVAQAGTQTALNAANTVATPSARAGVANQDEIYKQLQRLAAQLTLRSNGGGPNPAQAQLAQNTAANVAQTGALMAGARGASANPGMIARQAAQIGANAQQQAAGQAATLQAEQEIAAQNELQQTLGTAGNLAGTQVAQGVNAGQVAANAGNAYAGLLGNELQGYNTANIQNAAQMNGANAGVQEAATRGGGLLGFAEGGEVPSSKGPRSFVGKTFNAILSPAPKTFAEGAKGGIPGLISYGVDQMFGGPPSLPMGDVALNPMPAMQAPMPRAIPTSPLGTPTMTSSGTMIAAGGGEAPTKSEADRLMHDPKKLRALAEVADELSRSKSMNKRGVGVQSIEKKDGTVANDPYGGYAKGGPVSMRKGGKVPGTPKYPGVNTYANDTVDAKLTPKEIVLPLEVTQSKDPVGNAARFVAAVMARKGRR